MSRNIQPFFVQVLLITFQPSNPLHNPLLIQRICLQLNRQTIHLSSLLVNPDPIRLRNHLINLLYGQVSNRLYNPVGNHLGAPQLSLQGSQIIFQVVSHHNSPHYNRQDCHPLNPPLAPLPNLPPFRRDNPHYSQHFSPSLNHRQIRLNNHQCSLRLYLLYFQQFNPVLNLPSILVISQQVSHRINHQGNRRVSQRGNRLRNLLIVHHYNPLYNQVCNRL